MVKTMYFQAASRACFVFSNRTSRTENRVVNSMAIHTKASSDKTGTASMEKRKRLK